MQKSNEVTVTSYFLNRVTVTGTSYFFVKGTGKVTSYFFIVTSKALGPLCSRLFLRPWGRRRPMFVQLQVSVRDVPSPLFGG